MKTKTIYSQLIKCFPAVLLLVFYISEAFTKYSLNFLDEKSDIQRFIKLIVLIFLVVAVLKPIKDLILPALLFLTFCLGQYFLPAGFNREIVVSFSKLLFPLFLFIYFNKYPLTEKSKNLLFRTFEFLLLFNGLLILLGFIFEIPLFNSYRGARWGFNGLFINTSTSSYIYAIAVFYFLLNLKNRFFKSWKTLFIMICCLLTGTKIIYIALFGSFLIYLLYYTNLNRKQRSIVMASIFASSVVLGYVVFFRWGIFNEIRQDEGLLSAILSYRDDLFMQQTIPYIQENWRWPNYLFGGISNLAIRSQMGFIDIFLFWGIIGGILYLYTFYKTFVPKFLVKNAVYIILILALMVFLAGNFFENASVAIYLLILKEIVMDRNKSLIKVTINE